METKHFANIQPLDQLAVARLGQHELAYSQEALVLTEVAGERSFAPVICFPISDCAEKYLQASATQTFCPIKGTAHYFSVVIDQEVYKDAAWYYPDPISGVSTIAGYLSFSEKVLSISVAGL